MKLRRWIKLQRWFEIDDFMKSWDEASTAIWDEASISKFDGDLGDFDGGCGIWRWYTSVISKVVVASDDDDMLISNKIGSFKNNYSNIHRPSMVSWNQVSLTTSPFSDFYSIEEFSDIFDGSWYLWWRFETLCCGWRPLWRLVYAQIESRLGLWRLLYAQIMPRLGLWRLLLC